MQLAKEEEADASRGILPLHDITASSFLHTGLNIEEHNDGNVVDTSKKIKDMPLWLPSSLPASLPQQLRTTGISPGLTDKELRLRRTLTGLVLFKKLNVSGMGQKKNTKMRTLFQRFNQKTLRAAERFCAARKALEVLDPGGDWQTRLQVLRPEDICGPGRERADKKERRPEMCEKQREESWIWLVSRGEMSQDIGVMEEHLDANLRVEWAKSQARAARWSEQVDLVAEEMRRTLAFLEWRAGWWRCQASRRVDISEQVHHGLVAYAERQADLLKRIAGGHVKH